MNLFFWRKKPEEVKKCVVFHRWDFRHRSWVDGSAEAECIDCHGTMRWGMGHYGWVHYIDWGHKPYERFTPATPEKK